MADVQARAPELAFLGGGGEMGALIRAFDWSTTSLGSPEAWRPSLKAMVRMALSTHHPIFIFWGEQHLCLYNDAFRASLGPEKHPSILGSGGRAAWLETWDVIEPQIAKVMRGEGATWHQNQLVPNLRHGELQDVYWTYGFGPIDDDQRASGVGGVLVIATETTDQVLAARRIAVEREQLSQMFEQAPSFMAMLRGPDHMFEFANRSFRRLVGHRAVIGKTVAQALPDAVEQGYLELLNSAYRSGKTFVAKAARYAVQLMPDGPVDQRFVDFAYQPITDSTGSVIGIFVDGVDVTDRALSAAALLKSEDELRDSEERLRLATEAADVGLWDVDPTTDTLFWPARVKAMFGISPHVPVSMADFYAGLHPDDREQTSAAFSAAVDFRRRAPYDVEYRTVGKEDGIVRWVAAKGRAVFDDRGKCLRVIGTAIEITDRRVAASELARREREFSTLLENSPDIVTRMTPELRHSYVSPAIERYTGLEPIHFIGKTHLEAGMPMELCERWHEELNEVFRSRLVRRVGFEFETPNGDARSFDARLIPEFAADGSVESVLSVATDMTERARAEELLRENDRRKDEFLATLAHELRNPLAPIVNALGIMSISTDAEVHARVRRVIERQVGQLVHLVDDLLDVSRFSQGKLELRREILDISAVLRNAVETSRPLIEARRHSLTLNFPTEPIFVDADMTRLTQVFANILNNAAKYTPENGRIEVRVALEGSVVVVAIKDDGIGIEPHLLTNVFEMFTQIGGSQLGSQSGLGIGLALVRRLIGLHEGTVAAHSEGRGHGLEVSVRLPARKMARVVEALDEAAQPSTAASLAKRRVLIADDNADNAETLSAMLRLKGCETVIARNGLEAVELAHSFRPEIALLDIGMPQLDGNAVARRIRAEHWGNDIVLVAVSGWGRPDDRRQTSAAGFDHHLVKPVDPAVLDRMFKANEEA